MKKLIIFLTLFLSNISTAETLLWYHDGGKTIDHPQLIETIENVLKTLPAGKIRNMDKLVHETLMVETTCGSHDYTYASVNWKNYGIAQIRADTAMWLLDTLFRTDRARFSEVYKYYDPETSMEHNLMCNVPFSIAICAELYHHRLKGHPLNTLHERASAWKRYYNTYKGAGTVNYYIAKNS